MFRKFLKVIVFIVVIMNIFLLQINTYSENVLLSEDNGEVIIVNEFNELTNKKITKFGVTFSVPNT